LMSVMRRFDAVIRPLPPTKGGDLEALIPHFCWLQTSRTPCLPQRLPHFASSGGHAVTTPGVSLVASADRRRTSRTVGRVPRVVPSRPPCAARSQRRTRPTTPDGMPPTPVTRGSHPRRSPGLVDPTEMPCRDLYVHPHRRVAAPAFMTLDPETSSSSESTVAHPAVIFSRPSWTRVAGASEGVVLNRRRCGMCHDGTHGDRACFAEFLAFLGGCA
jgi:hypothetical protein